jgi:short-subunit dehydrogenase
MTAPTNGIDSVGERRPGAAVIVGAGPGVGTAVARRFGREGHAVGLLARDRQRLEATRDGFREQGIESEFALADVREDVAVEAALGELEAALGPIEMLCVSPLPDIATIKTVVETTAEDFRVALELGMVGTAAAVGRVLPSMRAARRGTLLFTTGSAALKPNPERATSGVVNAAQSAYFQMLHDQLSGEGIYALHTVIVGPIGPEGHDPDDIAAAMWDASRSRELAQIVISRDP